MRLIDGDALIKHCNGNPFITDSVKSYVQISVATMPTIEERKTGKWERHYSRPNVYADLCWHCSNCGYKTPDNWANKWKFCPNCGARMVQEGEDNEQVN